MEVLISVISSFLGVNLKDIKASLNKENLKTSEDNVISVSIDSVSKNLQDSKEIIENALLEIEKQKKLFEQMKQEAEISQQITTMNQEQVNALNTLLENTLNKQEKKTFPKTLLWNLFFCLLSAILGYILGKCYIEELEVKKTEGEKLLNDLVGAELPDGTHSEEFPAIKQRYFDIAKEFSKMLKTVINCQLEELLCKSN